MEEVNNILDRLIEQGGSLGAHEAIGIYSAIEEETDLAKLVSFMEKYEQLPGQNKRLKAIGIDVALDRLVSLKEDNIVLEKLQSMDSFEGRKLVAVMSACIRAKSDERWMEFLNQRYEDFTPAMKHTVMVNLIRIKGDSQINKFLLEHILDLDTEK